MAKKTELSIVLTTVDKATAPLRALNARLEAMTKPLRGFKEALGNLRETSGLDDVIGGFKGVGSALAGVLSKLALIGGVAAGAVAGMMSLIDQFDSMGDVAEKVGVSVDALAQLRDAAKRSGASAEQLDAGLANLSKNLGLARANTGSLAALLNTTSPPLLKQLKAAKSNEEAFNLLADAMAKLQDPAKRAALAQQAFGDISLAPLLARGSAGIKELRQNYAAAAGPQAEAVKAAGEFGDALDNLHAATDGVKAALVTGLSPALKVIVDKLAEWFTAHREDIAKWAADVGKKLPGAVDDVVKAVKSALKDVLGFVDAIGGWKVAAVALAAIMVGPLISAIASLGIALLTTPVGWFLGAIALIAAGVYEIIKHWDGIKAFFSGVWDRVKGAFSAFWGYVSDVFLNYTPLGLIIKNWGPIKGFFVDLWEGVKAAFMAVINFIVGKVEWVIGKIKAAKDWLTGDDDPEAKALIQAQMAQRYAGLNGVSPADAQARVDRAKAAFDNSRLSGIVNQRLAKVQIELKNAPRGTRVTATEGGEHLDLSVGYLGAF